MKNWIISVRSWGKMVQFLMSDHVRCCFEILCMLYKWRKVQEVALPFMHFCKFLQLSTCWYVSWELKQFTTQFTIYESSNQRFTLKVFFRCLVISIHQKNFYFSYENPYLIWNICIQNPSYFHMKKRPKRLTFSSSHKSQNV